MTRQELQSRWIARRDEFNLSGALVDGAKIVTQFLTDLGTVEEAENAIVLTLKQAAAQSGYSVDHLARMVRSGLLPNAGRRNAPRIRAADLPYRPKQFDGSAKRSYDVSTDARTLRSR